MHDQLTKIRRSIKEEIVPVGAKIGVTNCNETLDQGVTQRQEFWWLNKDCS